MSHTHQQLGHNRSATSISSTSSYHHQLRISSSNTDFGGHPFSHTLPSPNSTGKQDELFHFKPESLAPPSSNYHYPSLTLLVTISLSASLTLLNKSIYTTFQFPYPFYLLALHFASISVTSRVVVSSFRSAELESYRERVTWSFWFRNVLSVGVAYGSAILCSNLAYLILSVSFVQMLKAFTPVILVITTACLDHRLPPMRTVLVILTISSGVAIAAYGEIQFVLLGVLFQLAGSLAEVARLIATQRLLQDLRVDPLVALSVLSPICFVMALILAPILEGIDPLFLMLSRLGIPLIVGSILLALALNIVVLFLVSSTNALVLTLAGIVKDICLIAGSVIFLGSHVTTTQILGYSLAASGLVYFKFSMPPSSPKLGSWSPRSKDTARYESLPMDTRGMSHHHSAVAS